MISYMTEYFISCVLQIATLGQAVVGSKMHGDFAIASDVLRCSDAMDDFRKAMTVIENRNALENFLNGEKNQ